MNMIVLSEVSCHIIMISSGDVDAFQVSGGYPSFDILPVPAMQ